MHWRRFGGGPFLAISRAVRWIVFYATENEMGTLMDHSLANFGSYLDIGL